MSAADFAEFLQRAQAAQRMIDEAIDKVAPAIPERRSLRSDGQLPGPPPHQPQQVPVTGREKSALTLRISNQDAHGRLLRNIVVELKRHPRVAWVVRMNTGAFLSQDGERRVRCGWKGMLDILGQLRDGRILAIEGKTGSGRASADQKATIATITDNGGCAFVARSVADAVQGVTGFVADIRRK